MRLGSVVLQSKKGENVVMVSSPALEARTCISYANFIYEYILQTYRRRLRIDRVLTLQPHLSCVLSINKEYILYVFVGPHDLGLAFDAVKKFSDFFNSSKLLSSSPPSARLDIITRKSVEFTSAMEEFLYTRQINFREYLPLQAQPSSRRKPVDWEILNKFSHIFNDNDRKVILDSHTQSFGIEAIEGKRRAKVIEQAKRFTIRSQEDDFDLVETDTEKESFMASYRSNIARMATCGRRRVETSTNLMLSELGEVGEELLEENEPEEEPERENIRVKMSEKLSLTLQNAKVKEVLQFGQVSVEGTQAETATLHLVSPNQHWLNSKVINKRVSPTSAGSITDHSSHLEFTTTAGYKSKPIIDYIMRKESFTPEKIPLLFVYSREVSSSSVEFTFKYKLNEKWKARLYDVDISVHLNKSFMVMDCKSIPTAYALKNNRISWKCKEIAPGHPNAKGKIILGFGTTNLPPKHIIQEIKLTMKANCGLIDSLQAECQQQWGHTAQPEKTLLVEYKIAPNEESTHQ